MMNPTIRVGLVAAATLLCSSRAMPQRASGTSGGWQAADANPVITVQRVLVIYDMEGLSGVDRFGFTNCLADSTAYKLGREHLAADVNAVVDGVLAGGASDVRVLDQHGSGCDATPDLPAEKLHPRAKHIDMRTGDPFSEPWDAVLLVGMHARGGSGGFLAHTGTFGGERIVNDRSVSEPELLALGFGARGVPIVFVSGDDRLRMELAERLPWLTYVTVKTTQSPDRAALRPVDEVRQELRVGAQLALQKRATAKALKLVAPFTAGFRATAPLTFEPLKRLPGYTLKDDLVTFDAASMGAIYGGMNSLYAIGRQLGESRILNELRDSKMLSAARMDSVFIARWLAGEAKR
jgi:D-amino peptidase